MVITESQHVALRQHHALRFACCAGGIEQHKRLCLVAFGCVLLHVLEALRRITAVQRQQGLTGLRNRQWHEHHQLIARDGIAHCKLAAGCRIIRINRIGQRIYFRIGQPFIARHYADGIRLFFHTLFEARYQTVRLRQHHELRRIASVEPLGLLRIAVLDVAHALRRSHRTQDGAIGLSELLHVCVGVISGGVRHLEGVLVVVLEEFAAEFPARRRLPEVGIRHRLAIQMQTAFVRQHGTLIDEHHLIVQPEVAHGILVGVVLILAREVGLGAEGGHEFAKLGFTGKADEHRQGVHHHRGGHECAAVAASPEDRAERSCFFGSIRR